jgi:hypothetical protein
MQTVKCRNCKKEIKKENSYKHPTKDKMYFCDLNCYNNYIKNKSETKNTEYHYSLTDYIQELYQNQCNWPWIMSQIKHYKKEYGWTDAEILLTLRYYVLILEKNFDTSLGLGQVFPQYYQEALDYTKKCLSNQEKFKNIDFNEKVVFINNTSKSYYQRLKNKI